VLVVDASTLNSALGLDATAPDYFWVQPQARPIFSWALSLN
jgi:hypothetical protein